MLRSKLPDFVERHQPLNTTIQLQGRGMVCSLVRQNSLIIGCRDGTLLEIDTKTLKLKRELQTGCSISTIEELQQDVLILGQNTGSGWAKPTS